MSRSESEVFERVRTILAAALDRDPNEIQLGSSLVDDLGAESIDFLDIQFRLEDEFALEIDDDDIWTGSLDLTDPRWVSGDLITPAGLEQLKRLQPDYEWHRLGTEIHRADLARLITPRTIVRFVGDHPDIEGKGGD